MTRSKHPLGTPRRLETLAGPVDYYPLEVLEELGAGRVSRLPFSVKVLLEAAFRQCDDFQVRADDVASIASWRPDDPGRREIPFKPARVVMQDFTGVPAVVDLAALRSATNRLGGDPRRINPVIPVDLVIDHSVQVDRFGAPAALRANIEMEFERNRERYEFLRWGATAFDNFRVVPPAMGIVHQVNLEYLARVVQTRESDGGVVALPDSLVGTDSHTTMINGLGVVGWGVGGIEAEACMLAQPLYMLPPEVVGFHLSGELPEGATATDLVLTITEILRQKGVVGKFVEFYGPGLSRLSLADRATLANMAPEYGATMGFFPVDDETLVYLRGSGRSKELVDLVERYMKEQGLFRTDDTPAPEFTDTLSLDMGDVEPCIAGPRRPQDRIALRQAKKSFRSLLDETFGAEAEAERERSVAFRRETAPGELRHGSVVIAAITSCTNTSNPRVMVGAGLLARKAVDKGLGVASHVKTSLAPGSRVVTRYLEAAGVLPALEKLGFHVVGYGCTTCIGNSGPLPEPLPQLIEENDLLVASVLSGNRNFEGRVHPSTRANYLASPPLVVAYALAGTMDIDLASEPLGHDSRGEPVFLRDIWPSQEEVRDAVQACLRSDVFNDEYSNVFGGSEEWNSIEVHESELYEFQDDSTYIREPSFFDEITVDVPAIQPIVGARCLALLGDTVTTDHISPAGAIPADGPAGRYLIEQGVQQKDFNSFGSRRGNHEVMVRGTFGNIRLRNRIVPGVEGGYTVHFPSGEQVSIYDASRRYDEDGTQLIVIAGKEYGTGSSRDWAAKGTMLLGVKAVIARSYERIHRSNLIGMGVLPLQFRPGESAESHGLTGAETFDLEGLDDSVSPGEELTVRVRSEDGRSSSFQVICRLDSPVEVGYYRHGGILHQVLRTMISSTE